MFTLVGDGVLVLGDERETKVSGHGLDETGVLGGFGAEVVVEMGDVEGEAQGVALGVEGMEKGGGVGPAGGGYQQNGTVQTVAADGSGEGGVQRPY